MTGFASSCRALVLVFAFLLVDVRMASALVCEPVPAAAGAGTATSANSAAITATGASMMAAITSILTPWQADLNLKLGDLNKSVLNRLTQLWKDWSAAQKASAAQLSAGAIDQTRQILSMQDAASMQNAAQNIQEKEYEAKKIYQPTEEGCNFDTAARYKHSSSRVSKGMNAALASDLKALGSNKKGSAAARGPAAYQAARWATYIEQFCDPNANAKAAGCSSPGKQANADIMPGKTLLLRDTINMDDEDARTAAAAVTFNLTNYKIPEKIDTSALRGPVGKDQRNTNREYLTQMDATAALVNTLIAERTPGEKAPEIQAKRIRNGVPACPASGVSTGICASATPSARELRQATLEEIRNPKFYVELQDDESTATQKEIYLQAYNLMVFYEILDRMEMIANTYAMQTGNMLQAQDMSRGSAAEFAPARAQAAAQATP